MRSDAVTVHIDATPEVVYDLVSDVTRMGEWSPECHRCRWIGDATGAVVGARFKADNKRGRLRWSNAPVVTAADRGREFAFSRAFFGSGEYLWRYRFEPAADGGTEVTESYEELRPEARLTSTLVNLLFTPKEERAVPQEDRRCRDRLQRTHLRWGMTRTLERLKASAESLQRTGS